MSLVCNEIGKQIRQFRQNEKMTLDELASLINKSKATLSKYENGSIAMDIETLYDLAKALGVHPQQLLYREPAENACNVPSEKDPAVPVFFKGLNLFYAYFFDGRNGKVSKSVLEVFSQLDVNRFEIAMYMNCKDVANYRKAENSYWGYIEHFDTLSLIELMHQDTSTEKASIQILASFLDSETKWGLWNGVSSRPLMPVAAKMLFSKKELKVDEELIRQLKLSKEDIKQIKYYNMLCVF